ncbi:MAG: GTP 3',8-cyclase MoaA [Anaerolineaceae bacterium]|nr:GTP 3',8-cyclase MoaA [Anaerolineaceae bacterium]
MLIDRYQREISYLRVSVTDRCNFRCVYCMPAQGVSRRSHDEILTYEEIISLVRKAVDLGIRRVRLTGGEPLIRRDLVNLVRGLHLLPGLEEISLTTNGFLLEDLALPLKMAGLTRVNISLDTLDAIKFKRITRGGSFEKAWNGILTAQRVGLKPVKLNAVVVNGVNDDELIDLARLTYEHDWQMRFIELMPVGNEMDWGAGFPPVDQRYLSVQQMHAILDPLHLEPIKITNEDGPARIYRIPGAKGTLGFISPLGEHFCENCNRLRLTADGNLRPCLLVDTEIPVREALRAGTDVGAAIKKAIDLKPEGHELEEKISPAIRRMFDIGG